MNRKERDEELLRKGFMDEEDRGNLEEIYQRQESELKEEKKKIRERLKSIGRGDLFMEIR